MKLHRADMRPDWELIPPKQRSNIQNLAARTGSTITPGNLLSFIGLVIVIIGLVVVANNQLWRGLVIIGVGRLCDILDGIAADRTSTKSPTGEAVDATFDKLAAFASLVIFAVKNIIPWPLALIVGIENLLTSGLSLAAKQLDKPVHPVAVGKIGAAIEWAAFLAFILGAAIHTHSSHWLIICGYLLSVVAIALNALATLRYAQLLFDRHSQ